jgi:hypothetical protein
VLFAAAGAAFGVLEAEPLFSAGFDELAPSDDEPDEPDDEPEDSDDPPDAPLPDPPPGFARESVR